jgi:SAM-dependent methyltransferase
VTTGDPLPLTGERTVPGIARENYWFRRHEVVYAALAPACRDAVVLDAGAGEGYGAASLARVARRVVATELDAPTAAHVDGRYRDVSTVRADLQAIPVASGSVDVVVNLQVIEHLYDQPGFVAECARVLRPGGRLFCATPNRLTFSPGRGPDEPPLNPFHTRELDAGELAALVAGAGLEVDRVEGLHHGPGLRERDARHGGSLVDAQIALALSGEPWPEALLADVAAVGVDEFDLRADDLDTSLDLLVSAVRPPR